MKFCMRFLAIMFLISGFDLMGCMAKGEETKVEPPWNYKGYTNLNQMHLRYYYVFGNVIEDVMSGEKSWDDAIKDNTGIVEVWYSKEGNLLRMDRYIEKLEAICNSYEGEPPDTISYNGKTYSLYNRIIQRGIKETSYTFRYKTQTDYNSETNQAIAEGCYYEKYESDAYKESDPELAVNYMITPHTSGAWFSFYAPKSADTKELETAGFGLMELMNQAKYNKIMEGWKVKETIAGRTAVKNYGPLPGFWSAEGYQFIDTEFGIGLAGYLESCKSSDTNKETKFAEPKLIYEALVVETNVSPDVFDKF